MSSQRPDNNFTPLRILFAALVVAGHYFWLSTPVAILEATAPFPLTDFAVQAFFVTSGYLVTDSFSRERSVASFYIRRLFRIYPLYIAAVLVQAAVMSALLLQQGHFRWLDLFTYIAWNAAFMNFMAPAMGGLFDGLVNNAINPSLWTLKLEILFYLLVPVGHRLYLRYGTAVLIAIFVLSTAFYLVANQYSATLARQLPGQLRFFVVGAALFYWRPQLPWWRTRTPVPASVIVAVAVLSALLAVFFRKTGIEALYAFQPLLVGIFVATAAFVLPALPRSVPDVSYGMYLAHGPLVQLALLTGIYSSDITGFLLILSVATLLALPASALIEKPGIALGRRLVSWLAYERQIAVASSPTAKWPESIDGDEPSTPRVVRTGSATIAARRTPPLEQRTATHED